MLVTYEIVCSKGKDPAKAALLKAFLKQFSSPEQQKALETIGYAPLPDRGGHQGDRRHQRPLLTDELI